MNNPRFITYANIHLGFLGSWHNITEDDRGIKDLLPPESLAYVVCEVPVSSREIKVVDQIFALALVKEGPEGPMHASDNHHVALIQVRRHGVDQFVCVGSAQGEGARASFLSLVTQAGEFMRFRHVSAGLRQRVAEVFPSQDFEGSLLSPQVVRAHNNWFDLVVTEIHEVATYGKAQQGPVYTVRLEVTRTNIYGGETLCRDGDPSKPLVSRFELEATGRDLAECRDQLIEKLSKLRLHGITSELLKDHNKGSKAQAAPGK